MPFLMEKRWNSRNISLLSILLLALVGFGFAEQFQIAKVVAETKTEWLVADQLGGVYTVHAHHIEKRDAMGSVNYQFQRKDLGPIQSLDVSDALKPLVYYPDFAYALVLDNTLSPIAKLDLLSLGYDDVPAIARASDQHIWMYDYSAAKIIKLNENGEVLLSGEMLTSKLGEVIRPVFMLERNSKLYLSDPDRGIYVFDTFGSYLKRIPVIGVKHFQFHNNNLLYIRNNDWMAYNTKTLETITLAYPLTGHLLQSAFITADYLYSTDGVNLYVHEVK